MLTRHLPLCQTFPFFPHDIKEEVLFRATLAQLVERLIRNQQVAGSIPAGGSRLLILINVLVESGAKILVSALNLLSTFRVIFQEVTGCDPLINQYLYPN